MSELEARQTANIFALTPADSKRLASLCGQYNSNIKSIEGHFGVSVSNRGNLFQIDGDAQIAREVEMLIKDLYVETENSRVIEPDTVQSAIARLGNGADFEDSVVFKIRKTTIRAHNRRQTEYLRCIGENDISIGVGPAGTGKTYLAVASAAHALANDEVSRIVLVRPVVEAGERLGFLPGDIGQKVNPYLRPLYDALYELFGFERVGRLLDRGVIELAPLAFMRGRTLNDAFVILDEAQNTTIEQMKMFLTRIGHSSQAVITGDVTQIDLPKGTRSGLKHAVQILQGIQNIGIIHFRTHDVVRHPLIQSIIEAYEKDAEAKT